METSREDVGIAIRSALLSKGTQQRFSLFALTILAIVFLFLETVDSKPLNHLRSFVSDVIYRGSSIVSYPSKGFSATVNTVKRHVSLYKNYKEIKEENSQLKDKINEADFLLLENTQLRKLIDEQASSHSNFVSARVMLDKQSPYLNSFIINSGSNKKIKNGMAVLDGTNFIGRIVDVNFFSSRVLLISDLNSKIAVLIEPSGYHAILNGRGTRNPTLEYLPIDHNIKEGDKVYTSGKEGIFSPGIPIGEVNAEKNEANVITFSNLNQITFVNIDVGGINLVK